MRPAVVPLDWRAGDFGLGPYSPMLPPAPRIAPETPVCGAQSSYQHFCLRPSGHTGRHAAYGTQRVVAVWA